MNNKPRECFMKEREMPVNRKFPLLLKLNNSIINKKTLFIILGIALTVLLPSPGADRNYETDTLIVRQLLDHAGISRSATEVTVRGEGNGRVIILLLENLSLTQLPAEIGDLDALEALSLDNNNLKTLPAEICRLQALEVLSLEGNGFMQVPQEISRLKALQYLWLSRNLLTSVPGWIAELPSLTHVYLDRNRITALPAPFAHNRTLRTLDMSENNLCYIPDAVENRLTTCDRTWKESQQCDPDKGLSLVTNLPPVHKRRILLDL